MKDDSWPNTIEASLLLTILSPLILAGFVFSLWYLRHSVKKVTVAKKPHLHLVK